MVPSRWSERIRECAIAALWVAGGVLPLMTLAWLLVDPPTGLPQPPLGSVHLYEPGAYTVVHLLLFVPTAFVGASLALRPGAAPIAWVMLAVGAANGIAWFARVYATHGVVVDPGSLPAAEAAALLTATEPVAHVLVATLGIAMLPTGRLPRGVIRLALVPPLLMGGVRLAQQVLDAGPLVGFAYLENPLALPGAAPATGLELAPLWPITLLPVAGWLLARARHEPRGRRVVFRRVAVMLLAIPTLFLGLTLAGLESLLWLVTLSFVVVLIDVTVFAARRERLWGMPALVHRTALWVTVSASGTLIYAALLALGAHAGSSGGATHAAALAVAIAGAASARTALDGALRRRLLGDGADARGAALRLYRRLPHAPPERAAELLAQAAASGVRGARVAVELIVAGRRALMAGEGPGATPRVTVPIAHDGHAVGFLTVLMPEAEGLAAPERRLLGDLAAAAAPALDAQRLALELEQERRLGGRDRERIGRLLDERLAAPLESLSVELRAVDRLDDAAAARLLDDAYGATAGMVEEVRSLARALTPPEGSSAATSVPP
jgi:hypothetical protein